ncbi:TonB-dependent receptor plug domain-containing protein [Methylomonas sp. LL1]|uniref:TonB-dependent receptor n=1 Tax=Methylomonas sp. LL1 TaxID=2785785 RepID=UPI0018C37D13|nr:TonB-dependent receptor [Methylomonas sp. LL1]QPK64829.1 TonB-dependent receptor plug domain-containing protein [Methylomonas sp. LL1]
MNTNTGKITKHIILAIGPLIFPDLAICEESENITELDNIEVHAGRGRTLLGIAGSASQGEVGQAQFEYRPMSRAGELVEVIPGAVATQHSGSGKANQFFLRGFNLDHGTDFSVNVDGIPMNMPTHAHGQGYLDLNSIIPELVDKIDYGKGPYYAEVGDFSAAGYARIHTKHKLDQALVKFTAGEYGYYRGMAANSTPVGDGDLLYAGEFHLYDGVWRQPEDLGKFNGMIRYSVDKDDWGVSINGKAYHAGWMATNQIPDRAVRDGRIGLYDAMDNSDGGNTNRYSLASNFWHKGEDWKNDANIYALYTDVNLYSNYSGYTLGPEGDQIWQHERRVQVGGNVDHTRYDRLLGFDMDNTVGLQLRHDELMGIRMARTQTRNELATVEDGVGERIDDVSETSVGLYIKNQTHWLEKFRTIAGLRSDFFNFDVSSRSNSLNSGNKDAAIVSPKLSLILGPWYDSEAFINMGYGYHSNDARGTAIRVDPDNGAAVETVKPLVWSRGGELGVRSNVISGLKSTVALWWLQSNGELIFVGDSGTTEPAGGSQRYGVEWTNYYKPADWLTLDADFAWTKSRFEDLRAGANYIPNSVGRVFSAGAVVEAANGLFGTVRLRHFGDVPLDEAGGLWQGDTSILNIGAGYKQNHYKLEVDVFNILDSQGSDIAYAYESRLSDEAEPVNGILRHPVEPRMIRGTVTINF